MKKRVYQMVKTRGDIMFGVLLGGLFFSAMIAIGLWFYTIVTASVWTFAGRACSSTLGELTNGVCVDLSSFGIDENIACGMV